MQDDRLVVLSVWTCIPMFTSHTCPANLMSLGFTNSAARLMQLPFRSVENTSVMLVALPRCAHCHGRQANAWKCFKQIMLCIQVQLQL